MEMSSIFPVLYGRSNRETPNIGHVCGSQEYQSEAQELRYVISSGRRHFSILGAFVLQLEEETVSPVVSVRPSVRLSLLVEQRVSLLTCFYEF
jgi:hypothetical protein